MSNLKKLQGIGQEFLVTDAREIIAEFIDGNFSQRVLTGDKETTVSIAIDQCDCDDCLESEEPCHNDCDSEWACTGCREAEGYESEAGFEIGSALGRF